MTDAAEMMGNVIGQTVRSVNGLSSNMVRVTEILAAQKETNAANRETLKAILETVTILTARLETLEMTTKAFSHCCLDCAEFNGPNGCTGTAFCSDERKAQ
jgi:hypothetical protein